MQFLGPVAQTVGKNWTPFPQDVNFVDGNLWKTQAGDRAVEQYYDGSTFLQEAPATLLAKTAGLILGGRYFFIAATGYHMAHAVKEGVASCRDTWTRYRLAKAENAALTVGAFLRQQENSVFEKAFAATKQAGKSLACLTPFLFAPNPLGAIGMDPLNFLSVDFGLGNTAWYFFAGYCVYHPQYPRVLLSKIENWMHNTPSAVAVAAALDEGRSGGVGLSEHGASASMAATDESGSGGIGGSEPGAAASTAAVSAVPSVSKVPDSGSAALGAPEPARSGIHYRIQELFEWKVPISTYLGWERLDAQPTSLRARGRSRKGDRKVD